MATQEKVPKPKEQELAKERLSSCDRPTSATLASPFFSSTFGDLMSCKQDIGSLNRCRSTLGLWLLQGTVLSSLQGIQTSKQSVCGLSHETQFKQESKEG